MGLYEASGEWECMKQGENGKVICERRSTQRMEDAHLNIKTIP